MSRQPEQGQRSGAAFPPWLIPVVITALAAAQVVAFHWGVITPDTVEQYRQALSGRYEDWHPPVTAWLWRQLGHIGHGSAPFLILDVTLYWFGIGLFAETLRRRGDRVAALVVIACGALPIPFGQIGAILKDPLLATSCLAAAGLIAWHAMDARRWPLFAYIACVLLLILANATRFNALFAVLPLALAMLPSAWLRGVRRAALAALIATVALIGAKWAVDDMLLKPAKTYPFLSLVTFDLAGIAHQSGDNPFPNIDAAHARAAAETCYTPALYDPHDMPGCGAVEDSLRDYVLAGHGGTLAIWGGAIARHPIGYLVHRIEHLNRNWRWLVPGVPDDAFYIMSEENDLGLGFTPNRLTMATLAAARVMAISPLGRPVTWLAVALGTLILAPGLPSSRLIATLALSALGYGSAYTLVSVAPDLRYNLWTMLAAMLAAVTAAAGLSRQRALSPTRLALAAAPLTLVVAGELVWLAFALPPI